MYIICIAIPNSSFLPKQVITTLTHQSKEVRNKEIKMVKKHKFNFWLAPFFGCFFVACCIHPLFLNVLFLWCLFIKLNYCLSKKLLDPFFLSLLWFFLLLLKVLTNCSYFLVVKICLITTTTSSLPYSIDTSIKPTLIVYFESSSCSEIKSGGGDGSESEMCCLHVSCFEMC